jgi:MGT family glycosyltransferase
VSRFLFVTPPLAGHVTPTAAVGAELAGRGHDVAWAAHPELARRLLPAGSRVFTAGTHIDGAPLDAVNQRSQGLRGAAALKFLWEGFQIPLARSMRPEVEAAVDDFAPDVMVVDQQALAGALVARSRGLRWVTSATTSAELCDPLATMPGLHGWVAEQLATLDEPGADDKSDLRFSEHLVLAFTAEALVGAAETFPDHYAFVGPSLPTYRAPVEFPWDRLDTSHRHVLVSLGTVTREAGGRFLRTAVEAFGPDDDVRLIVVAPDGLLGPTPDHVLVRDLVPQLRLLPHLAAVVTHAGHNTVCESLAHGLPLVLAPVRDDQPIIAGQVVDAGAGIRVKFGRVRAPELRAAVLSVLDESGYREAAARVGASLRAAGGAVTAADRLEKVAP